MKHFGQRDFSFFLSFFLSFLLRGVGNFSFQISGEGESIPHEIMLSEKADAFNDFYQILSLIWGQITKMTQHIQLVIYRPEPEKIRFLEI